MTRLRELIAAFVLADDESYLVLRLATLDAEDCHAGLGLLVRATTFFDTVLVMS